MPYGPKRLNHADAMRIRTLYAEGDYTQQALAKLFDVSQSLVCKIINNSVHRPTSSLGGKALVKVGYKYGD